MITVCREIANRRAISACATPSAASTTIRARNTSPDLIDLDRIQPCRTSRSPSRNTNGAARTQRFNQTATLSNYFGSSPLDFKQALYGNKTEDKQELTKDVSALANAGGGILVLGVAEDNSAATSLIPLQLSADEEERMRKICHYQIRPFLPGVEIHQIPDSPGASTGYYVISVPRSADAPHAIIRGGGDNGDGTLLSYPLRDGQVTRYLAEAEIARRYRDRFISRTELAAALNQVHDEGCARISSGDTGAWLTVAAHPTATGTQRVGGSATVNQIRDEVREWASVTPAMPGIFLGKSVAGHPGIRRAVVTGSHDYHGTLNRPFAELHFNGAGFAACPAPMPWRAPDETNWPMQIAQDLLELHLHAMASLLSAHAASSGAGGDCDFRAQLRLAPHFSQNGYRTITPTVIAAPEPVLDAIPITRYEQAHNSITMGSEFLNARTTTSLDELTHTWHASIQTAYSLAVDILGHFAIADTCVLRADGTLEQAGVQPGLRKEIATWINHQTPN